jgi:integrase
MKHHSGSNLTRVSRDWRLHVPESLKAKLAKEVKASDIEEIRTAYLAGTSQRNLHLKEQMEANKRAIKVKPHNNNGANKLVTHINLVFGWAVKTERLQELPYEPLAALVEQEAPKTFLTKEQIDTYLEEIDRTRNLHVMVMVRAMLYLAMREDEARQMRWRTFNADRTSYQPFDTKTGKIMNLPVKEDLWMLLDLLRKEVPEECEWVCPAEDGQPHRQQITKKAIERGAAKLGITGLTPHKMRGSCATMVAREGVSAFAIKKLGRWKCMSTVEKYVNLVEDDLREAQEKVFGK